MVRKDQVLIKIFSSKAEAELAKWKLEEEGIPAVIEADDAGGMYPFLHTQHGVRLFVSPSSAEEAARVLEELEDEA